MLKAKRQADYLDKPSGRADYFALKAKPNALKTVDRQKEVLA